MGRLSLARFRELDADARLNGHHHLAAIEASWRRALSTAGRRAADQFERPAKPAPGSLLAAVPDPHWQVPDPDEIAALRALNDMLARLRALDKNRLAVIRDVMTPILDEVAVAFDVTNPLAAGVARNAGANIAAVSTDVRGDIMSVIQDSYDQGRSIPQTAAAIRDRVATMSQTRAERIARTELAGLVNGSSVAAARLSEAAEWKQWLATADNRTRPDHAEASGQVVPIAAPFIVGGYEMQYPGDQTAPPDETVACRCTVIYPEGPEGDPLLAGGAMPPTPRARLRPRPRRASKREVPAAIVAAAQPGARWRALLVPEGQWTSDGRMFDIGSVTWRDLPLTLMAQIQTDVGHDGARVAGRIDSIYRDEATNEVWGEGEFDSGPDGVEAARLVGDGTLSGISVDVADLEFVIEIPPMPDDQAEAEPDPSQPVEIEVNADTEPRMRATHAVLMGATVTPFPAFAECRIELVSQPADAEDGAEPAPVAASVTNTLRLEPVTAAAVDNSAGSMVALYMLPDEAAALALADGQPADDLHLTLAFLPDGAEMDALVAALEPVAQSFGSIIGDVTGAGHFAAGEDGTPIVALIDAYGLDRIRVAVLNALDDAGIVYATNHGFLPHVTLSYSDEAQLPAESPAGRPVTFLAISAVVGAARQDLALDGGSGSRGGSSRGDMPEEQPPARASTAAAAPLPALSFTQVDVATLQAAMDAGLLTRNEAREFLGQAPAPGGDLALAAGTDPAVAALAAALDVLTLRQPAPAPVHVAAADVSGLADAVHAIRRVVEAGNEQLRATVAATRPPDPQPIIVYPPAADRRPVRVDRDADGRVTGYTPVEEG